MYKLIIIHTHGVAEFTGTQIFIHATFNNTAKKTDGLVGMFMYDERGVLIKTSNDSKVE